MSSTTVKNNTRTFINGSSALDPYILVKVASDGTLATSATTNEPVVGFTTEAVAANEATSVSLLFGGGTSFGTAAKALAIGTILFNETGGKLSDDASGHGKVGIALSASAADGDIIEVLALSAI